MADYVRGDMPGRMADSVFTSVLRAGAKRRNINISETSGVGVEGWRGGLQKLSFISLFAQTEEKRTNLPPSVPSNNIYTASVTVGFSLFTETQSLIPQQSNNGRRGGKKNP